MPVQGSLCPATDIGGGDHVRREARDSDRLALAELAGNSGPELGVYGAADPQQEYALAGAWKVRRRCGGF